MALRRNRGAFGEFREIFFTACVHLLSHQIQEFIAENRDAQQMRVAQMSAQSRKWTYSKICGLQNFFLQFSGTFEGFSQSVARGRSLWRNTHR